MHTATGARRTATADNTGVFTIAGLPPGSYELKAASAGFATVNQSGLRLSVGQTTAITIQLPVGGLQETISVRATSVTVATSREARLADSFGGNEIQELPLPQRDIFALPKLSVGATAIPGAANSTKLSSSPVITVNGNRYRGNNYVLDGAMNTNPNNTGEPAIVPSLESVQEVQVQTLNFASEFGRGNGAVINISTKSGTNAFTGRAWEFHRSDTLNAKNHFATDKSPQKFNQYGVNLGGPVVRNRTFFFGSYEGTREEVSRPFAFQVETPEFRAYATRVAPNGVTARLLNQFPAPTPLPGVNGQQYLGSADHHDARRGDSRDRPRAGIRRRSSPFRSVRWRASIIISPKRNVSRCAGLPNGSATTAARARRPPRWAAPCAGSAAPSMAASRT